MIKKPVYVLLLIVVIAVTIFAAANNRLSANDSSQAGFDAKLDMILNNQQQIIQKLDNITAELKIVKIRATR